MRCPVCQSLNIGNSPTGNWCNTCGWASPGYGCEVCGRIGVNEKHRNPDGDPCLTLLMRPDWVVDQERKKNL